MSKLEYFGMERPGGDRTWQNFELWHGKAPKRGSRPKLGALACKKAFWGGPCKNGVVLVKEKEVSVREVDTVNPRRWLEEEISDIMLFSLRSQRQPRSL